MERRVEHRDVWNVRERAPRLVDRAHRRRVVQRRERLEPLDLGANVVVDQHWLAKARTAVHDAMRDRRDISRDLVQDVSAWDSSSVDDVQLQARRARVDYENGQTQSRTSGWSSPYSRVHAR